MPNIGHIPTALAQALPRDMLYKLQEIRQVVNESANDILNKASIIDNPVVDNFIVQDANGGIKDSGKDMPAGDIVGTTDFMEHDHKSAAKGGDYDWADLVKVVAGVDPVAVTALTLDAGADSVDRAAFNTALGILITEINAIKDIVNNIWDKLQATNLMT